MDSHAEKPTANSSKRCADLGRRQFLHVKARKDRLALAWGAGAAEEGGGLSVRLYGALIGTCARVYIPSWVSKKARRKRCDHEEIGMQHGLSVQPESRVRRAVAAIS